MARRVNYLNNKDMLAEIHKSKNTFASYVDPSNADYDIILPSVDKINIRRQFFAGACAGHSHWPAGFCQYRVISPGEPV